MNDKYLYLIVEPDWNSDEFAANPEKLSELTEFQEFEQAVADLGATVAGGLVLQSAKYGGRVTPGEAGRQLEDAVYTDIATPEGTEVVTGFYTIEVPDLDTARKIAALVPTGGHVEWRKVFPFEG